MFIALQNFPNLGNKRIVNFRLLWRLSIALLISSLVFAVFTHNFFSPVIQLKKADELRQWLTVPTTTHRAYFRHTFSIDDEIENAWLMLASSDYQLYVNGHLVGQNTYLINASQAFTSRLQQKSQQIYRAQHLSMARSPELQRRANKEFQLAHYYDLSPYLHIGENVISLGLQSDQQARFSIYGQVQGAFNTAYITAFPDQWKTTSLANKDASDREWYATDFHDNDWQNAIFGGTITDNIYARDNASIWRTRFQPQAMALSGRPGGDRLRMILPGSVLFDQQPEKTSWLRINSSLPYSLLIDGKFIAAGSPGKISAFDISQFVSRDEHLVSIITKPSAEANEANNWLKADGSILGNFVPQFDNWQQFIGKGQHWLTQKTIKNKHEWLTVSPTFYRDDVTLKTYIDQSTQTQYRYFQYYKTTMFIFVMLIGMLLLSAYLRSISSKRQHPGCWWLITVLFVTVSAIELLRLRFIESDAILFFLSQQGKALLWCIVIGSAVVWWLAEHTKKITLLSPAIRAKMQNDVVIYFLLLLLLIIAVFLRISDIGLEDLQADENVSWDAARGILRTGFPEAVSGVLYTRSPLYHYLLSGWLWLWGDNIIVARLYSLVPALGVIILSFQLIKLTTKNKVLALITAAVFTFDSWGIQISHIIRFYQQMQFFGLLATYLFIQGFIWRKGKCYQYGFFAACTAGGLSQEVFVTVFPAYSIAFILYYKNFNWKKDIHLLFGFITAMAIIIIDIYIFSVTCLTPHVSVATTSGSILQLHLSKVMGFFNTFFIGNNRANLLMSLTLLLGFGFWLRKGNKVIFLFYLLLLSTMTTATVLVMQVAGRYLIAVYPYLILITVLTFYYAPQYYARQLAGLELLWGGSAERTRVLEKRWTLLVRYIVFTMLFIHLEAWKTIDSYGNPRFPQHLTAMEYIQTNRQENDRLMSVHPMPAAIVFQGIDYYLMDKVYFDELYVVDRGVIDRWSGGILVSSVDKVRELFLRHERVWIVVDELELRNLSPEILAFIYSATTIKKELFGVEILLWDKKSGLLPMTIDHGGAYNSF
ncbi:MAG: hypothetical protein ACI9Y1_000378 [Lentisphaeria bacterium]|jgi:hypothetical protein